MKNYNLMNFRESKKMSMSDMAEKIGISTSFYEKIEYGQRTPSFNFIVKFKKAFPESNTEHIFLIKNNT